MLDAIGTCERSVSVLYALIFGAQGACVALSFWSILALIVPFALAVMLLQALLRRALFGRNGRASAQAAPVAAAPTRAGQRRSRNLRLGDE